LALNGPSNIIASAESSSSIRLSWPPISGATGYRIYRSLSRSGTYTRVGTITSTSFTNTGLASNTTYYYKVSAYNNAGESAQSSMVSARTRR
jgi:fibronectin type 3 domain-containing protein